MSTTYRECAECGKRALSVATRCPQCGAEFPPRPLVRPGQGSDLRRTGPRLVLAGLGLLASAAVAVGLIRGHRGTTAARPGPAELHDVVARAPTSAAIDSSSAAATGAGPVERGVPRVVITWANV